MLLCLMTVVMTDDRINIAAKNEGISADRLALCRVSELDSVGRVMLGVAQN